MSDPERLNTGYAVSVRKTREYEIDANDSKRLNPVGQVRTRMALVDRFGLQHDPQDVGIGISQILPVVVAAADGRASLVCIEQPELHVHPAVQVGLGDLFIDGAVNQGLSFLVETHSEHLVMRLQRRLREQISGEAAPGTDPINPKDVSFIYLGRNDSGHVEATQIGLTEDGKFDASWPNGFFIERSAEVLPSGMRAKLQARLAREEKK
jgi:predicted ATPase